MTRCRPPEVAGGVFGTWLCDVGVPSRNDKQRLRPAAGLAFATFQNDKQRMRPAAGPAFATFHCGVNGDGDGDGDGDLAAGHADDAGAVARCDWLGVVCAESASATDRGLPIPPSLKHIGGIDLYIPGRHIRTCAQLEGLRRSRAGRLT